MTLITRLSDASWQEAIGNFAQTADAVFATHKISVPPPLRAHHVRATAFRWWPVDAGVV